MILNAIFSFIMDLVATVISIFPEYSIIPDNTDGLTRVVSPMLNVLNKWLPIPTLVQILLAWIAAESIYSTVVVINWVISKVKGWL